MKKPLFILALLISVTVFAQGKLIKQNPTLTNVNVKNFVFHPDFLNAYIRVSQGEILPFKITDYRQKYFSYKIEDHWVVEETAPKQFHLQPTKTIALFRIIIAGTYEEDGEKKYANLFFEYTDKDLYMNIKSLIENYDKKGKLVFFESKRNPKQILPNGNSSSRKKYSIANDRIEYIHKSSNK